MNTPTRQISAKWLQWLMDIIATRAYSVIGMQLDDAWKDDDPNKPGLIIQKMEAAYQTGQLDLIYAQAHELLGNTQRAEELRAYVLNKEKNNVIPLAFPSDRHKE